MIFYPSCTVRMLVRFEELAGRLRLSPDRRRRLDARIPFKDQQTLCPIGKPAKSSAQMPVAITGKVDELTHVVEFAPRSVTVEVNSYRIADTVRVLFNFRDFPFDPRIVRAAAIEVYLGALSPDVVASSLGRTGVFGPERLARFGPNDGPPLFVGVADSIASDHDESGEYVEITGRDFTAALLDTPVDCHIETNGTLKDVLERILRIEGAPWEGLQLDIRAGAGESVVDLTQIDQAKLFTRVNQGADGKSPAMNGDKLNWWDVVTILCLNAGVIPQITLSRDQRSIVLAVSTPRAIIGDTVPTRRRLIFGRNLKSCRFERKLSGVRVPAVVVTSWDPDRKRTLRAVAPKELATGAAQTPNTITPSGQNETVNAITQVALGIKDQARLQRIADSLFQQVGRQELTGRYRTRDLIAFTDSELLPDDVPKQQFGDLSLLTLRTGDPIDILVAAADLAGDVADRTSYGDLLSLDVGTLKDRLKAKGFEDDVAGVVAEYLKSDQLQSTFRQRALRVTFDNNAGVSFDGDFCNFYEVRETDVLRKDQTDPKAARDRAGPSRNLAAGSVTRGITAFPTFPGSG